MEKSLSIQRAFVVFVLRLLSVLWFSIFNCFRLPFCGVSIRRLLPLL